MQFNYIHAPPIKNTHKKTLVCDMGMDYSNSNYHYPAGSCRGWAGRASHSACWPTGANRTFAAEQK